MGTLTETAYHSRKIIKYSGIGIIAFFILKNAIQLGLAWWKKLHPPPPPPPTVEFGVLPKIQFPESPSSSNLVFKLETPTGGLPDLPEKANVYFMPYLRPNLLALDKAKEEAKSLGFKTEPKPVSEKIYRWTKEGEIPTTLEMDIFSGKFEISYNWQMDSTILLEKNLPGKEQAKLEIFNLLSQADLLAEDIQQGDFKITYLRVSGPNMIPTVSLSEADFVRVDLFRKKIDDLPLMTVKPEKGIISAIISGSRSFNKRLIEVKCNYFPIQYYSSSTYPLKSAAAAWQELKGGQAFIVNLPENTATITVRRVYLAYFDSEIPQQFLQPIVVFEGDYNFVAYVSAIAANWVQ